MSSLQRPPKPTTLAQALTELDRAWNAIDVLIARDARIDLLSEQLAESQARIADLERELREASEQAGKSSRNSSKPPSSDSPSQRANRKKKRRSARAKGAQPGHAKHDRRLHSEHEAESTPRYLPPSECACGGHIDIDPEPYVRHQVFDIPVVRFTFVEHQLFRGRCAGCGKVHNAQTPASVPSGQMGPNLIALITHLAGQFHLSIRDIQCFLYEHYGLEFSTGAISQAQGLVLPAMAPTYQDIGEFVRDQPVVHADETRHFRGANLYWFWALACTQALYFMTHYSRGMVAAELLIGDSEAVIVTDDYSGYNRIEMTQRQLCWCHLIRHLIAMAERRGSAGKIGCWLALIAYCVFRTRHRYEAGDITEAIYQRRMIRLRQSFQVKLAAGGRLRLDGRTKNQCRHLIRREPMFWTFLTDDRIPLENNLVERAVRQAVMWRKTSYGTHSHRGDCFRPMVLSVLQTAKLHGVHGYEFLRRICTELIEQGEVTSRLPLNVPALPAPS